MTDFSADHEPGNLPPTRFRPGPGQMGATAAMRGGKGQGEAGPAAPRRPTPPSRSGPPAMTATSSAVERSNADHLHLYARYRNAQDLGRDLPFALWAAHNGYGGGYDPFWDGM